MSDTPIIKTAIPIIPAQNMDATVEFYENALGFKRAFTHDGYVGIRRDGAEIHIYHNEDRALAEQTMFRLAVNNIEALYKSYQANQVTCKLETKPWGTKDMAFIDPSGNCLTFYEDV